MAKDKKSVLVYCDLIHTVEHLPDELAGKLFKHFLAYVNDQDPQTDDVMLKIAFEPIKQQLKRDLKKYNNIVERNRKNGSKGGRPKNPKNPVGYLETQKNPKKPIQIQLMIQIQVVIMVMIKKQILKKCTLPRYTIVLKGV